MGNWRTVNITGRMDPDEAKNLIAELSGESNRTPAKCLSMGHSLCGLNQWVTDDGFIDAIGNLAEHDFDNDDIEKALAYLADKYHSLQLTLHSGSDWEKLECTATFHVTNGKVERCEPEVKTIHGIPQGQSISRLFDMLYGG